MRLRHVTIAMLWLLPLPTAWAQQQITLLLRAQPHPSAREAAPYGVRGDAVGDAEVGQLAGQLARQLEQEPDLVAQVPVGMVEPVALEQAASRARTFMAQAEDRYRKFDEPGVYQALSASQAELLAGCGGADRDLLRALRLLTGLAHFVGGRRDEAMRNFIALSVMDPAFTPDPAELAPKVVAALQEASAQVAQLRRGQLQLEGTPVGARVRLDGAEAGRLPLLVEDLIPGAHCLVVDAPGYAATVVSLTIAEGGAVRQRLQLFPRQAEPLRKAGALPDGADAGEAARWFSSEFLALGDVSADAVELRLLWASSPRASHPIRCSRAAGEESLLRCLQDGVRRARSELGAPKRLPELRSLQAAPAPAEAVADLQRVVPDAASARPTPAWYRRWWVWAIAGGLAAAGTAASLWYVLSPPAQDSGYRVIVTR